MKNKQNCCTRSRIQSKIGLGNAGSGAYSSASIPTDFEFPFAELGVEPWIKQGSPKLQEVLWSLAPWLQGSVHGRTVLEFHTRIVQASRQPTRRAGGKPAWSLACAVLEVH